MTEIDRVLAGLGVAGTLFLVLVALLWVLLPFAVLSIRREAREQTCLLRELLAAQRSPPP